MQRGVFTEHRDLKQSSSVRSELNGTLQQHDWGAVCEMCYCELNVGGNRGLRTGLPLGLPLVVQWLM